MGMGYGAGYADVIEEKSIKKICPKEFEEFIKSTNDARVDLDNVARFLALDYELDLDNTEDDEKAEKLQNNIVKSWKLLQKAFNKKTKLELDIGYHDPDDGDRYDDISGYFFCVDGMYQLSPAGKKMNMYVDRKFFVTFG